jgi:hypothetical protein
MPERQKGKAFAFGGLSKTPITITNQAGTPTTVQAVIETFPVNKTATNTDFTDGDGAVDGRIITNKITRAPFEFYVSEDTIANSESKDALNIEVGDKLTVDDPSYAEVDDGSHSFIVEEVGKTRSFGKVRLINLTVGEYENDITGEATA